MQFELVMDQSFIVMSSEWSLGQARRFMAGLDFSHVVVIREAGKFRYLFTRAEIFETVERGGADTPLFDALQLHESGATEVRECEWDGAVLPERVIILKAGEIVGFLDSTQLQPDLVRRPKRRGAPARSGLKGIVSSLPGDPVHEAAPAPFEAYPALTMPVAARLEQKFDIIVGFRDTPDMTLVESGKILVAGAEAGRECLAVLIGDSVTLDRDHDVLPLRVNAMVRFSGTLTGQTGSGSVKVLFFYEGQLIGTARRVITQEGHAGVPDTAPATPAPLIPASADAAVDITVSVTWCSDGSLEWRLSAPSASDLITRQALRTSLPETRQFAADLLRDLKTQDHRGPAARNILENVGQDVAALMPTEFFTLLREVHGKIGRPPTLLLLTNETFVPWELALLDPPLDGNAPPFLAASTRMGRWLEDMGVMLPPSANLAIRRITAVASQYGLRDGTAGLRELKEAIKEQETLVSTWHAVALTAAMRDMTPMIRGIGIPGHLVHFAVHGYSDPRANDQALLLADGSLLPASALTGAYKSGDVPRFSFVFLNACQVGTPGRTLGHAGGFPGTLVRRGTIGFIAPLWEVDDDLARERAESFYREAFGGQPVGAVLQTGRAGYVDQSTTPMAYIFYGHPALRLTLART